MNFSTVWLENSLKIYVTFVHLFEFQSASIYILPCFVLYLFSNLLVLWNCNIDLLPLDVQHSYC